MKSEKRKELKKELNEVIMLVSWHPRRWRDFCMSENDGNEIEPPFTE